MGRLSGKVAIVTGAGTSRPGIGNGKASAILFAREGARVVLVDRTEQASEETRALIKQEGGEGTVVCADVSQAGEVSRIVEACKASYSQIDILHNNVGISSHGGILSVSPEDWDHVFSVNLRSMFLMARAVIPEMLRSGGGSIINVSSISAVVAGGTPMLAYSVSKAAVLHFTRCIALEFADKGVRCNGILPGLIDTPMVDDHADTGAYGTSDKGEIARARASISPTGAQGTAWDVANTALFLASDESKYVNGQNIAVDGGLTCLGGGVRPLTASSPIVKGSTT